jgi:hypothetical protein
LHAWRRKKGVSFRCESRASITIPSNQRGLKVAVYTVSSLKDLLLLLMFGHKFGNLALLLKLFLHSYLTKKNLKRKFKKSR